MQFRVATAWDLGDTAESLSLAHRFAAMTPDQASGTATVPLTAAETKIFPGHRVTRFAVQNSCMTPEWQGEDNKLTLIGNTPQTNAF